MRRLIGNSNRRSDPETGGAKRIAYLAIVGMECANCASNIQIALLRVQGISDAIIDHRNGLGKIIYSPQFVSNDLLLKAVRTAGNDGNHHYEEQMIAIED